MKGLKNWLPAVVVCLVIFAFSSLDGTTVNNVGLGQEKLQINGHFFLYFVLCIAFYKATKNVPAAILLCVLYSLTDELHQTFVPGRSWQFRDLMTDALGAILAGTIIWKFYSRLPKTLKNWLSS